MTPASTRPLRFRELEPHHRRLVFVAALLRSALLAAAVVTLYFVWPTGGAPDSTSEWVSLVAGLTVFSGVFVWEVRSILSSRLPEARALEALAVVGTLFVVMVSALYLFLDDQAGASFSEPLSRMGALYFTVTVFATVGFGDISPVTDAARGAVTVQMVLDVVFIGLLVKVILGAAKVSLSGTPQTGPSGEPAPGVSKD